MGKRTIWLLDGSNTISSTGLGMNVSELLQGTTVRPPVAVSKEDSVLQLGTMLSSWDVSSVFVTDGSEVLGALYGYQLVAHLMNLPSAEILSRLSQSIGQVIEGLGVSEISYLSHRDDFQSVLKKIAANRYGDVTITDDDGEPIAVLSLSQIIPCLVLRNMTVPLKVRDVASRLKVTSEEQPLSDSLRYMMLNRIRRTVVKRDGEFYGLTEREFIEAFFSSEGMQSLSQDAGGFLNSILGEMLGVRAKRLNRVNGEISVHEAWERLVVDPSACLVVDDDCIATPWDLVMKPFLEDKLNP